MAVVVANYSGALSRRPLLLAAVVAVVGALLLSVGGATVAPPTAKAKKVNHCKVYGDKDPRKAKRVKLKKSMLCFINRERASRGLVKVKFKVKSIHLASQRYARHMQKTNCFSHNCPGQPAMVKRLKNAGYPGKGKNLVFAAENLAWGSGSLGTVRSIFRAWMNSPGHRANLLAKNARDVGIGILPGTVSDPGSTGGVYTLNFGKRN